jgi:hypothetical protein
MNIHLQSVSVLCPSSSLVRPWGALSGIVHAWEKSGSIWRIEAGMSQIYRQIVINLANFFDSSMSSAAMLEKTTQTAKRKRGVLLSPKGWKRLQDAEQQARVEEGGLVLGKAYTLQELSELTGLSPNTLARVRGRKIAVDQQTLDSYFRTFDLVISSEDFTDADLGGHIGVMLPLPVGQLPLDSAMYVARPPVETLCYEGVNQPGGLVRLKATRQMGKTSLVARTLMQAREQGSSTVILSLRLADSGTFQDLQRFLQWFCAVVSHNLGLPSQVEEHWDNLFGASYNCTHYFEKVILKALKTPLVLALDEVDAMFDHPEIASDFFGMLRAWYEKARYGDANSEIWQKMRLILVHSTEVYVPLNLAQSPFNAGWLVEVPGFNLEQVEDLAQRYRLDQADVCAKTLFDWVGGNPHLIHLGLYQLSLPDRTLTTLIDTITHSEGIYGVHLRNQMWEIQKDPAILDAMKRLVTKGSVGDLEPQLFYKLQSKGWVLAEGQKLVPSCRLYQTFFKQALTNIS